MKKIDKKVVKQSSNENYKPFPGDFVEVSLFKKKYNGILLETPSNEKGIVLLKLNSGYNIGFNKKDIIGMRVLQKFKKIEGSISQKKVSSNPNIAMIITGGTIASRYDSRTGGVSPLTTPESLFEFYPEIFEKVNVLRIETPFVKNSENINFKDWQKIARVARKLLNDSNIKGIIITHGTDFLHYTSSALSFFLRNLNKPVVLTYSQKSVDRASSDANLNLKCSALAAISDISEVMLVGHANSDDEFCYAMPGTKVRKMHTSRRDSFEVINQKPLAKIYPDKVEILRDYNSRKKGKVKLDLKFEEKVVLLKIFPGQSPDILDYYYKKGYKGIVLELSGLGHLPLKGAKENWIKKLKEIQSKGVVICAASQTIYGSLNPFVYSTGREILETGVIYLEDMLSETAFVKLGWVLGHKDWAKDKETVKKKMLENISGEFNKRLGMD